MRSSLLGFFTIAACLVGSGVVPAAVRAQGAPTAAPMTISSPRIPNGSVIPTDYVCTDEQGMNKSPQLLFPNVPSNAQSLVLKVDDPDAPNGYNAAGNYADAIVHWLLYNVAPTTSGIQEGAASPPGTAGASYDGTPNYQGPCPPMGTHRYFFRLYALNGPISPGVTPIPGAAPPNTASSWSDVMTAMAGKVVACATLLGIRASGPNQPTGNPVLSAPPVDSLCPTQPINNAAQPNQQPNQQPSNAAQPAQPSNAAQPTQPGNNPTQPTQPIANPLAPVVQIVPSTTSAQAGEIVGFAYSVNTTSVPVQNVLIAFGDGAVQTGSFAGGTVTHAYSAPGNYAALVTATDTNGLSDQDEAFVFVSGAASAPPPTTVTVPTGQPPMVQLTASPTATQVGQQVFFNYTTTAGSAPIESVLVATGDGVVASGQIPSFSFPYIYDLPGTYQATVTATDANGQSGRATTTVSIGQAAQATTTVSNGQPAVPTIGITYPAGWNLIAAPPGTVITGASLPLYTWQNGDVAYALSTTTQPGFGYWAYFTAQSTVVMTVTAPTTITKTLQPNVYIMIGNAGSTPATVRGADVVYIYNPASGYQTTNVLQPGQGAWVLSSTGGNVTLTNGQG